MSEPGASFDERVALHTMSNVVSRTGTRTGEDEMLAPVTTETPDAPLEIHLVDDGIDDILAWRPIVGRVELRGCGHASDRQKGAE
ncbi:MAG: hypothetical protein NVSMB22_06580 [Chloroflexota bacterium]